MDNENIYDAAYKLIIIGKISIGNGLKWNFIWWFYTKFKLIMRNDIKINNLNV